MKYVLTALGLILASPAMADVERLEASGTVAEAIDRLEAAVENAGGTVFARVDHTAGAKGVGMEMQKAELLIFGNPKLGTPIMQQDITAGLYLPLRMLAYSDADGQTWVAYEEIEETLDDIDTDEDAEAVTAIEDALRKLSGAAAGG